MPAGTFGPQVREAGETVNLFPANPGNGTALVVPITAGEVWKLSTLYVLVTTDIAATPRDLRVEFMTLAGLVYWQVLFSTTIANVTSRHVCVFLNGLFQSSTQTVATLQSKLPVDNWLFNFGNSERLRFNLVPFGGDDQLTGACLTYQRWRA